MLNVVSGCAGIGGIDLGFHWTGRYRAICYIEWEQFPQAILLERMREGLLDSAPIWSDFSTFDGKPWRGLVDVFISGIPCQPHSTAGKRRKGDDNRNLWPSKRRIITEMEPRYVVVENVEGLYSGKRPYGPTIAKELYELGYAVLIQYRSACQEGAPHERMRTFTVGIRVADTNDGGSLHRELKQHTNAARDASQLRVKSCGAILSDSTCRGLEAIRERGFLQKAREAESTAFQDWWKNEPNVGRVADGVPHWVDRIKALGNAVVPQVAYQVALDIIRIEEACK